MKRTNLLNNKERSKDSVLKVLSINEMYELRGGISKDPDDPKNME
jgi:hypothetical protein